MKVDPIALCSFGVYSEVYGLGEEANIANQVASRGYLEDAPSPAPPPTVTGHGLGRIQQGQGQT